MKFFGRKSAGRGDTRPALLRGWSSWGSGGEIPRSYEDRVREGYVNNPVAQRAVRLVAEGVGSAPVVASDPTVLSLLHAKTAGQGLIETVAMQLLLHGNAYVQVLTGADGTPIELFALRPERVTIEADARGWPVAFLYKAGEATMRIAAEDAAGRPAFPAPEKLLSNSVRRRSNCSAESAAPGSPGSYTIAPLGRAALSSSALFHLVAALWIATAPAAAPRHPSP